SSLLDRFSAEGLWDQHSFEERLYENAVVTSEFTHEHHAVRAAWVGAVETGSLRAQRVSAGIDFFQDDFHPLSGQPLETLPASRDFRYFFVGWENAGNDFVTTNYVDRAERLEDFNLGARLAARAGISPKAFGAPETSFAVQGEASEGWRVSPQAFVRARAAFQTRLEGGVRNAILNGSVTLVWKHPTSLLQTTVAHVEFDRGWNLDEDVQFFA